MTPSRTCWLLALVGLGACAAPERHADVTVIASIDTSNLLLDGAPPPAGVRFAVDSATQAAVLDLRNLLVPHTARVRVRGERPLVVFAAERITVLGLLDGDARGGEPGPGGAEPGLGSAATSSAERLVGGVGARVSARCHGGAGGGAVELRAGSEIAVTGELSAGGGDGDCAGGGAGTLWLDAPRVSIAASARLLAQGGGGDPSQVGARGAPGRIRVRADEPLLAGLVLPPADVFIAQ